MSTSVPPADAEAIRATIGRAALALDAHDHAAFLALCAPEFDYAIRVFSPELRKDMTWLAHDRAGLEALFAGLPDHLTRPGRFTRLVSVGQIAPAGAATYDVTSTFMIAHTPPDGASRLFATGLYADRLRVDAGAAVLLAREVRLHTRDLGTGSHEPL
jgi:methanesulfonate monooxygenase small subunit